MSDSTNTQRSISEIAIEAYLDWSRQKGGIRFSAKPYLIAMIDLDKVTDYYGHDPADMVIRYFLANASTWRGHTARRIKAELKQLIGAK